MRMCCDGGVNMCCALGCSEGAMCEEIRVCCE